MPMDTPEVANLRAQLDVQHRNQEDLTEAYLRLGEALDLVRGQRDELRTQLDAAIALHPRREYRGDLGVMCESCDREWPCPTANALGVTS